MKKKPVQRAISMMTVAESAVFFDHFAMLLKSGVPILATLMVLAIEAKNPDLNKALIRFHDNIKGGEGLSGPMRETPELFTPTMIAMVEIGEAKGTIDVVFQSLADHYKFAASLERSSS